jgi:regulator of replication initiation timing
MRDNVNIKLQMTRVMQRLADLNTENQRLMIENRRLKDENDINKNAHGQLMKKHAADHRLLQLLLAKLQQDDEIFCSLSGKTSAEADA